jgi:hypothetical protein
MDDRAAGHYVQYGCGYNKDIPDIVQKVKYSCYSIQ